MSRRELLRAAEASGAEQGEKCDGKRLRNMREAQELDGKAGTWGPLSAISIHLSAPLIRS